MSDPKKYFGVLPTLADGDGTNYTPVTNRGVPMVDIGSASITLTGDVVADLAILDSAIGTPGSDAPAGVEMMGAVASAAAPAAATEGKVTKLWALLKRQLAVVITAADGTIFDPAAFATQTTLAALLAAFSAAAPVASPFSNFGAATKASAKGSAGKVLSVIGFNATAPVATDVPIFSFEVPTAAGIVLGSEFFTTTGVAFSLGIGWAWSTTQATFTDGATANEHSLNGTYA